MRSWLPLAGSVATAAAGTGPTWESNPFGGERSGLIVMFGDRASELPAPSAWTAPETRYVITAMPTSSGRLTLLLANRPARPEPYC